MKEVLFTITENRPLAPQVYALRLCGDTSAITAPGQFLELQLPGFFLRRPLSVCDWDDAGVTILYKVTPAKAPTGLRSVGRGRRSGR